MMAFVTLRRSRYKGMVWAEDIPKDVPSLVMLSVRRIPSQTPGVERHAPLGGVTDS